MFKKGIMTGCLRISKESIFTGLNNFNVYSILENDNEENFGFTEREVEQMLEDYHMTECFGEVKAWYDGYMFGDKEIYNPWSTIKYVKAKVKKPNSSPQPYWANTSGNEIVYNYIQEATPKLREEFEELMNGNTVVKEIIPDLTYREMDDIGNIYSFLLMTGYLRTIQKIGDEYELIIPNREVYEVYRTKLKKYFGDYKKMRKPELYKAFIEENTDQVDELLNDILSKNISYYDNKEDFYHGYLDGLFTDDYDVESNKESGDGRFDLKLIPKVGKSNIVILIECKHSNNEDNLKKDASKGAEQIVEKNYKRDIQSDDKKIIGYGISFYKKKCRVVKAKFTNNN